MGSNVSLEEAMSSQNSHLTISPHPRTSVVLLITCTWPVWWNTSCRIFQGPDGRRATYVPFLTRLFDILCWLCRSVGPRPGYVNCKPAGASPVAQDHELSLASRNLSIRILSSPGGALGTWCVTNSLERKGDLGTI